MALKDGKMCVGSSKGRTNIGKKLVNVFVHTGEVWTVQITRVGCVFKKCAEKLVTITETKRNDQQVGREKTFITFITIFFLVVLPFG